MSQRLDEETRNIYLVDVLKDGQWVTQVRKYHTKQNPKDHPDTVDSKNFRPLDNED